MEIIGYFAAILIGLSLGLLGGGGSILTVPVLVYLFGIAPVSAATYSLFIVGISSFTGSVSFFSKKMIDFRIVLLFGLPSAFTIFLARRFIVPAIPAEIQLTGELTVSRNHLFMIVFAILMIFSSISMMRKKKNNSENQSAEYSYGKFILLFPSAVIIGLITGILGAGGGFVIIPVLVLWLKLSMKKAIGTSLTIIAINSLIGFFLSIDQLVINWRLFSAITLIAVAGILIGSRIAIHHSDKALKKGFGIFILLMAAWIFIKELLL